MKDLTVLEMLNQHPIAGALLLALLMSIAQIVRAWKGDKSVNRIESETNKLAKQTSETVNTCASRTHALIEAMEEFMAQNDVRRVHSRLDDSISLLEKVHDRESAAQATLVRVDNICRDILSSLERTDSRVVHGQIVAKIEHLQSVVDDIKRIEIDASKGG